VFPLLIRYVSPESFFDLVAQDNPDDFIKKVKADFPSIKVVVVTDLSKEELAKDAVRAGASEFVTKPIKSDELLAACK